jgi:hypothetical protein
MGRGTKLAGMDTSPARFDRVVAHPDYAATADRRVALPQGASIAVVAPVSFAMFAALICLIGLAIVIAVRPPWLFVLAFAALGLSAVGLGVVGAMRGLAYYRAPIVRTIGVVVRDRTHVFGGDEDTRASTSYYVTLQDRDGTRTEYATHGELAGRVTAGDIGVAFIKSKTLVDFVRLDV